MIRLKWNGKAQMEVKFEQETLSLSKNKFHSYLEKAEVQSLSILEAFLKKRN
jgi:hypothetical protein